MKAIFVTNSGELKTEEVADPDLKDDEVLIRVKATVVNGSDIIERKKFYGERLCLGLECSGIIEKIGKDVQKGKINEEVCAVLSCGGYAEKVAVPELQVFYVPSGVTVEFAACLPYAACTVWSNLFTTRELSPITFWLPKIAGVCRPRISAKETLLVHDDSNGIASFAIPLAKCLSINTIVTSSKGFREYYDDLGVDKWIDYQDFLAHEGKALGQGVDVILNVLGPEHFQRNLSCLKGGGRLISIGNFVFNKVDTASSLPNAIDVSRPHKFIRACAFQHRSRESKELIVKEVQENVWRDIDNGNLRPLLPSKIFTFSEVEKAHQLMESGQHFGKILLVPDI